MSAASAPWARTTRPDGWGSACLATPRGIPRRACGSDSVRSHAPSTTRFFPEAPRTRHSGRSPVCTPPTRSAWTRSSCSTAAKCRRACSGRRRRMVRPPRGWAGVRGWRRDRSSVILTKRRFGSVEHAAFHHLTISPREGSEMSINLRALIGKLNAASRGAVEGAAGLCLSRTHYDIEIEHFLTKALDATDGDLAQIIKHYGVNRSRLADDLARGLDRLKSGNARTPSLSPSLVKVLTEAWTIGSLEFGAPHVRTGHCLLALLTNDELARLAKDISREFEKIAPEVLHKEFVTITAPSPEAAAEVGMQPGGRAADGSGAPKAAGKTASLDQFTVDLTARARAGKIDPVLGRDFEVRQVVDILTRRRQNNPILVGEAGVGKTAVVEGFAR